MSWADVRDFISYLGADSALVSEMHPEAAGWQGNEKVPMLLAHIADTLSGLSYGYVVSHMKKGVKKPEVPKPIPRPGIAQKVDKTRKFGSDGIPIKDFDAWWDQIYEEEAVDG